MRARRHGNTAGSAVAALAALGLGRAVGRARGRASRLAIGLAVGLGLLLAAGCAPASRRTPDDTLVVAVETPMTTIDSRYAISNQDSKLVRLVSAGLTVVHSDTLTPELDLAARIDRVDATTYDVAIRPDARFSDGSPVLARDVIATFESVRRAGSDSLHHKAFAQRYERFEERGERLVRFVLKAPLATLWSDLDFGVLSARGLGAGPYRVVELTTTHVLLEANPHYHGPRPRTPRVLIKFVRDAAARLLMLVGGSVDLIQNGVRMDLVEEVRGRPRVQIATGPSVLLTYLMMNNADARLADPRVRQAIALAIDRRAIVEAQFGGHARLATGLLPATHWAYSGDVPRWDHDPARARALLDAAGLPDPDGPGPRPRLSLVYKTSTDAFRVAVARSIAAQLAAVGIAAEVRSFEFATFFADVKKGSYQLASMQTSELNEPDYYWFYFHSERIPSARDPDAGNRWRYANPALDRLVEAGRAELDRERRKAIYAEVQRIVAADVPIVPLWHEDNIALANASVQGYRLTPNARLVGLTTAWKQ